MTAKVACSVVPEARVNAGMLIVISSPTIPYVNPVNWLDSSVTPVKAVSVNANWIEKLLQVLLDWHLSLNMNPVELKLVMSRSGLPARPFPNSFPPTIVTVGEFALLGEF